MTTHKTLLLSSRTEPLQLIEKLTPAAVPGSVLVNVLSARLNDANVAAYTGRSPLPFQTPLIPGMVAIGRIRSVGSDAIILRPGQLVYVDCFIRGRDSPDVAILTALYESPTEGGRKLMREVWKDAGTYSEVCQVPMENIFPLDEERLIGKDGLGLSVHDLSNLSNLSVSYGGLRSIGFQAGETIIVAPSSGAFSGSAVLVALGMGAGTVIAMGRNEEGLKKLRNIVATNDARYTDRLVTVKITGDVDADTTSLRDAAGIRGIDAYLDISPAAAKNSTHMTSAIRALKKGGRISAMGGIFGPVTIPHHEIMSKDLSFQGKWMYERKDIELLIRMVETGLIRLGEKGGVKVAGAFRLEEWKEAFENAEANHGLGWLTVFAP